MRVHPDVGVLGGKAAGRFELRGMPPGRYDVAAVRADAAAGEPPASDGSGPPDAAVELAEKVLEAMGGREAWEATRYLRFDFFGRRLHHWDRYTGRHRLEGETQDGEEYVVLHNVQSRDGDAWLAGEQDQR